MSDGPENDGPVNGCAIGRGLDPNPSLITYPSQMAVKAMGLVAGETERRDDFKSLIESLVLPLLAPAVPERITTRASSGGKYQSVSVHLTVTSQGQLEAIYAALHAEPRVLFTL